MSLKSLFSLASKKSEREPQPIPAHPQCRYILDSNLRCRRQPSVTGSGLCLHHENEVLALRRDQSQSLTAEVYGPVKALDSAVAINHVLSNLFRLVLEDRIPQTKARLLTSMCRALLKSMESARHEITAAKLFPDSNRALLNLVTLLGGEDSESKHCVVAAGLARPGSGETHCTEKPAEASDGINRETVAPQSSLRRDRATDRTCAAISLPQNSSTHPESRSAVVAAGLPCPEPDRANRPGSGETPSTEKPAEASDGINRDTVAPPQPKIGEAPSSPEPEPTDHVIWLGPRPAPHNKK